MENVNATYRDIALVSGNSKVTDEILQVVSKSPKFQHWCDIQKDSGVVNLESVVIESVKFFGPPLPDKLGFFMVSGKATEVETGDNILASSAFVRGDSVAIFVIVSVVDKVNGTTNNYAVFTSQLRFPMGKMLVESCAGCVDASTNNVKGVAITELEEELGVTVNTDTLVSIGSIIPSGGGTYEEISLYYLNTTITQEEYEEKVAKLYGTGPNEKIRLVFKPLSEIDTFLDEIKDVKAECAWRRICSRKLQGFD